MIVGLRSSSIMTWIYGIPFFSYSTMYPMDDNGWSPDSGLAMCRGLDSHLKVMNAGSFVPFIYAIASMYFFRASLVKMAVEHGQLTFTKLGGVLEKIGVCCQSG